MFLADIELRFYLQALLDSFLIKEEKIGGIVLLRREAAKTGYFENPGGSKYRTLAACYCYVAVMFSSEQDNG